MAQVILLCGKICSGKSTYVHRLQQAMPSASLLSCDDLMLTLFPEGAGEYHDTLSTRARAYLFSLSLEILARGSDVILDWGFWTKQWRETARDFYRERGIPCTLHYIDIAPDVWQRHIQARNQAVLAGDTTAYFVDEGLLDKVSAMFEEPAEDEVDIRYHPD